MGAMKISCYSDMPDAMFRIVQRDEFTCARCGITVMEKALIVPFLKHGNMDTCDPDSYICLCEACLEYEEEHMIHDPPGSEELREAGWLSDEISQIIEHINKRKT
jgi:hypothetical protein